MSKCNLILILVLVLTLKFCAPNVLMYLMIRSPTVSLSKTVFLPLFSSFFFCISKMVLTMPKYAAIYTSFLPSILYSWILYLACPFNPFIQIPSNANCSKAFLIHTNCTLPLHSHNHICINLLLLLGHVYYLYSHYMMCSSCAFSYLPHLDSELPEDVVAFVVCFCRVALDVMDPVIFA